MRAFLGNNACETFEEGNAILLDAKDLFKGTDVTLYGIKTFLDGPAGGPRDFGWRRAF